jgi:general secretion pathway protein D
MLTCADEASVKKFSLLSLILLSTCSALVCPISALSNPNPLPSLSPDKSEQLWNFENADIQTIIKRVAEETGKNFIIDPRVQAKVTVISQHALNSNEVYQLLLSILRVHGFQAIESDQAIKIVPTDSLSNDKGSLAQKNILNTDQSIIKVFNLSYLTPQDALPALKELLPKNSQSIIIPGSNFIIIADTSSNILKTEQLLKKIDTQKSQEIDIISIKHASAADMANNLNALLRQKNPNKSNPVSIIADERTNHIVMTGGTEAIRKYVSQVIEKLDSPADNNYNSEVVYLKYIEARNIAPIVSTFIEDAIKSNTDASVREEGNRSAGTSASSVANFNNPRESQSTSNPNHLRALDKNKTTSGLQGSLFSENENKSQSGIINKYVQWEEASNALIIKAPVSIMRAIKSIIAKLDIRRPQVMIEVVIAEVNLNRLQQLGVEWNGSPNASIKMATRVLNPLSKGLVGGFTNAVVDQLGQGLSVGIFRHGDLRALIKLLASDSSANVLSTPTLVTLDNQTALIKVGQKVPFAVGQTDNSSTNGTPFTSFDREEVGLSLTIKPQITHSGEVKMQIENILSDIIPGTAESNAGGNPTTTERTVVTNVLVHDGKILVLGGLIQDSWQKTRTKVPLLGDLPLLGSLFRSDNKVLVKKNLMIFIRPKIINVDEQGRELSTNKYNTMRIDQLESLNALENPFVDEQITAPPLGHHEYTQQKYNKPVTQADGVMVLPNLDLKPPYTKDSNPTTSIFSPK